MTQITIISKAKCKHCVLFDKGWRGRKSLCKRTEPPTNIHPLPIENTVKTNAKACDKFKLFLNNK